MFQVALRRTITFAAGALFAISAMVRAEAIPCSPVDFGLDFGAPDSWTILTDQLAECGLTFSTVDPKGVYWWGTASEASFQYCITAGYLPVGGGSGCIDKFAWISPTRCPLFQSEDMTAEAMSIQWFWKLMEPAIFSSTPKRSRAFLVSPERRQPSRARSST